MKYVILTWDIDYDNEKLGYEEYDSYKGSRLVTDEKGDTKLFYSSETAYMYARENLLIFKIIDFHSYQIGEKYGK